LRLLLRRDIRRAGAGRRLSLLRARTLVALLLTLVTRLLALFTLLLLWRLLILPLLLLVLA
jgi:hypothetical protein